MARPRGVTPSIIEAMACLRDPPATEPRAGVGRSILDILRDAIVGIELPPGTVLTETDVANRFGVSRTPVREAFRILASEGLLVISPQRGSFVSQLNRAALCDALFVREALECAAVRLAARAPLEQRRRLARIVEHQRQAIENHDVQATLGADEDLHRTIMELSGHDGAWPLVRQARSHLDRLRRIANQQLKGSEDALEHHARIADAVIRGAEDDAQALLRLHIGQVQGFIDRIAQIHPQYIE